MSIFKTIADSDIYFYVDFRSGSGIDRSGNFTTSIGSNGKLVHKKLYSAYTLGLVTTDDVAINKSDFTIIAKHRTVTKLNGQFYTFGTGTDRGLLLYNNVLQTRIDTSYYTETLVGTIYDAGGEFVSYGFSADRDATGQFYVNGVAVGTAKNISAKANYDINYSRNVLTTYTDNTFETQYVLLLKKALTDTEMAQLTAELENKKWTSKTKSSSFKKTITPREKDILYKTENGIKADQKTYSTKGDKIANTDLTLNSGIAKIIDGIYNGEKVKILESTTTCNCSIPFNVLKQTPTESAYGEWEFVMSAPDMKYNIIKFISSTTDASSTSGDNYNISLRQSAGNNIIQVRKTNLSLIDWGSYFTGDQFYKIKVTRNITGLFSFYIDDVLIGTTTDASYTLSNYIVIVMETGSKVILSSEKGTYGIIKK